ncbi:hypothetical protein [Sinomicrobium sp.]
MMKTIATPIKLLLGILIVLNIALLSVVSYLLMNRNSDGLMAVERINIKDSTGNSRVVISNEDLMPPPILGGKTLKRIVNPAGLVFYDRFGNERGGIAVTDNEETNFHALAFDYDNADAIGLVAQDNKNDDYFRAGLIINDKKSSGKVGDNTSRIDLMTENGNAALVIKDPNSIPRIVLKVDSIGNPYIRIFDENGNPTWQQ